MSYSCCCHNLVMMLLLLCFIFFHGSPVTGQENPFFELPSQQEFLQMAGYGEEKLSTVLFTGSVHCEACLHGEADQLHAWPIPEVLVAANCHISGKEGKSSVARGITDDNGDYIIDIPSHLHAIPNLEKICSVKVLRIPKKSHCKPAYVKRHKGIQLSSFGRGIRTYSAGSIRFMHLTPKHLHSCKRKGTGEKQMLQIPR